MASSQSSTSSSSSSAYHTAPPVPSGPAAASSPSFGSLSAAAAATSARLAFEEGRVVFFRWHGSVLPSTLPYVAFFGVYAAVLCFLYKVLHVPLTIPQYLIPVLTIVLGLLMAFRTNLSYDRYWEGRKLWSTITSHTRACVRLIASAFPNKTVEDKAKRVATLRLLAGFAAAVKHHLRGEHGVAGYEDLEDVVLALDTRTSKTIAHVGAGKKANHAHYSSGNGSGNGNLSGNGHGKLERSGSGVSLQRTESFSSTMDKHSERRPLLLHQASQVLSIHLPQFLVADESDHAIDYSCGCTNIPLVIAQTLTAQIHYSLTAATPPTVNPLFANPILASITTLVDAMTNLDRILTTKIPLAYALHLKQILLLYTLALPFQIMEGLGWITVPTVMMAVFTLFGIDNIGLEIENPFGYDANDLDLDAFCEAIRAEVDDVIETDAYQSGGVAEAAGVDHESMLRRLMDSMSRRKKKAAEEAAVAASLTGTPSSVVIQ
ncbi:Bestrophin, RFP-TM, chloride channel-domain-containing protein [Zopfochytrium polystomum]|nr:Bestrophin, RFP-TM, chloride channel-domain-containing protein [Zopfochytrium polystomum]